MQRIEVKDHVASLLPEGTEWKLVWSDEFDGDTLDTSKWSFRLHFWGRRFAPYTDQGVTLDGKSNLQIHLIEKDGQYCSAQLQTGANSFDAPGELAEDAKNVWGQRCFWPLGRIEKPKFMHRYGYYETRCKFQNFPQGWWSAFWLQSPSIGTSYDPSFSGVESDIMEYFSPGHVTSGNIYGGYSSQYRDEARINYDLSPSPDGYHTFGLRWSPDGYAFYCDGSQTARSAAPVSQVEQFILLTTECQGYRSGNMREPSDVLRSFHGDDCFTVDYVRVFDEEK